MKLVPTSMCDKWFNFERTKVFVELPNVKQAYDIILWEIKIWRANVVVTLFAITLSFGINWLAYSFRFTRGQHMYRNLVFFI